MGVPLTAAIAPLPLLIGQLGRQTVITGDNLVRFNEPLVGQIASYGETAVPMLARFLSGTPSFHGLLEGLWTGQRLAQQGARNARILYGAVSQWNTHPAPLVQIYLAGLYRYLNEPASFGPMLATLMNRALTQYPLQSSRDYNITEEVGGTVLQQIANRTADETVRRLLPYLRPAQPSSFNRIS